MFAEECDMFFHPPSRLVETIFNGISDPRKAFQLGRIKPKEIGIVGGFDDQRILQIDHSYFPTLASSSTNFCSRSFWSRPKCFSITCVVFIEQNLGPHMEQKAASL